MLIMVVFAGTKVVKKSIHAANGRKKRAQVRMIVYGRRIVTRRRARSRLRSVEDARFSAAGRSFAVRRPAARMKLVACASQAAPRTAMRAVARQSAAAPWRRAATRVPLDAAPPLGCGLVSTSIDPAGFGLSKYVM